MKFTTNADLRSQVIAFAGVLQSAVLVDKLAQTGQWHQASYETCIFSIFQQNADNIDAIYGDVPSLYVGLTTLRKLMIQKERPKLRAVFRYCYSLQRLERQLVKEPKLLNTIGHEIERLNSHFEELGAADDFISEQLSSLYKRTVSDINPPIQVMGEQHILQRTSIQQQVRALLLAGIRSATLWHQVGGRPWRFLIMPKGRIIAMIDHQLQPVH